MFLFVNLYQMLDETTRTSKKLRALEHYFRSAPPGDSAWAIFFLSGRRLKQVIPSKQLRAWACEAAQIPDWLFQECYDAVGDFAETVALCLPPPSTIDPAPGLPAPRSLADWVEHVILPARSAPAETRKALILSAWRSLEKPERFVFHKLLGGGFRVGVSQQLIVRALAQTLGLETSILAHRLMGDWSPSADWYQTLAQPMADVEAEARRPYPFFLASPIEPASDREADPAALGPIAEFLVEYKWDGIRAQAMRRNGEVALWTRGEELVTDRYPEVAAAIGLLPDGTVLDGELLPRRHGVVLPFAALQKRIGRKHVTPRILDEIPVTFLAFDLLEAGGTDLRDQPLRVRRSRLETLLGMVGQTDHLGLSPALVLRDWTHAAETRARCRANQAEGLMIKRWDSTYQVGRVRGDWWKWKIQPYTVDAVLTAAQRGSGKRASLYTDYTFSIWSDGELVPIAKAYSGLTDAEIAEVDRFIRQHMREKFGPVRSVEPVLVFELAFEAIARSARHRSGIAVRFPRIMRWRKDKPASQADSIATLRALLPADPPPEVRPGRSRGRKRAGGRRPDGPTLFPLEDDAET